MNQNHQILEHLKKHKTITPAEAYVLYGVFRLSARILDLKTVGHEIMTKMVEQTGKRGKKRFAEYRLVRTGKVT